jgi:hypothetical protein
MALPRFSFAALRPAFVPEWFAIVLLALLEMMWARVIGFHLAVGIAGMMTPPGLLLFIALLRGFGRERVALFFEYAALSLLGSFALIILSYLCMASSGARADNWLLAADRALGFDWLGIYRRLAQHPALMRSMEWAYDSLLLQSFYITVLLGLRGQIPEMRALWRLSTIGCILCCIGAMVAPALGPFHDFGMDAKGIFLPAMRQLLAKQNLTFSASALTGVICFPSFHTVLALTCPWALRRCGPLFFWSFAALNLVMLCTIPFLGGHYLSDMIAGAAIFAAALGIVTLMERKTASAANVSPGFVAASAGAYSASSPSR